MMTGPERFDRLEDMYAALSNAEMGTVLDGGSARVVVRPVNDVQDWGWLPAWIDLDGLWIEDDEPGYVQDGHIGRWVIDHAY